MSSSSLREHLGELQQTRDLCVFINCPFDAQYQPVLEAIIFACVCCGFMPRISLETGTSSIPRLDRIKTALRESRYSIHELGRCRGKGDENLARFNMPLELGMAMNEQRGRELVHDWAAIVPTGHGYHKFVSDLSGFDPIEYDTELESLVSGLMAWLSTRPTAVQSPTPADVLKILPTFAARLQLLRSAWYNRVPWADVLLLALEVAEVAALIAPSFSGRPSAETSKTTDSLVTIPQATKNPNSPFRAKRINDRIDRLLVPFSPPMGHNVPRRYQRQLNFRAAEAARQAAVTLLDGTFQYPIHVSGTQSGIAAFGKYLSEQHDSPKPTYRVDGDNVELWVEYHGTILPSAIVSVARSLGLHIYQCGATLIGS